ncbi:uncharacterized protein LOC133733783 isoform X2 [Rosa rugosa]|uniref:uncharacterized protein LOC133733783 isoform X2 n=1 Tax=Rosa rugosa TaxID=74645 RepID=UPI002B404BF6|nr:uncharacterized protein LOC133733783 isoform X2 [Rosa rugosa]
MAITFFTRLYSGVVAEDREALISGVPSLSISLNWRKDESQENDFKDAVAVCLPLINAAIRDIEKGEFPKSCFLNIEIPSSPLSNKAMAPRSNNTAKAKAIALRMKALQMKRDKKTVSKPAVEETNAPPKSAFTKHDQ